MPGRPHARMSFILEIRSDCLSAGRIIGVIKLNSKTDPCNHRIIILRFETKGQEIAVKMSRVLNDQELTVSAVRVCVQLESPPWSN